jgi:hypothetical protein
MEVAMTTLLDGYLPDYHFSEFHSTVVQASPDCVYRSLKELTASDLSPLVSWLLAIRSLPGRLIGKEEPQLVDEQPFLDQLFSGGFVFLAETMDREIAFGLVGKFWKLSGGDGPPLVDAQEFLAFDDPDSAKVVANLCVDENQANGGVRLSTETRIYVPHPAARKKFGFYWRLIYPGSALIRRLWLRAIKRRAERS